MNRPQPHLGLVLFDPYVGSFFWTLTANCLHTEAMQRGVRLSTVAVQTIAEQAAALEQLLEQSVDALVMKPMSTHDAGIAAILHQAHLRGIPVITLDSTITDSEISCTVGSDNVRGQAMTAEYIFERLGKRGKVAYFQGDQGVPAGVMRARSFTETLSRYPEISLCHEIMMAWTTHISRRVEGARHMRDILAQTPDLGALISSTDEGALGALDALEEAGLIGKILVAGFDGTPEALLAVRNNRMAVTLRQRPDLIAAHTLDAMLAAMRGESLPPMIFTEIDLITMDNVYESSLSALQMMPGLILNLADNHQVQQRLQQAVIANQQHILQTVIAVSSAVSHIRDPGELMDQVIELICQRFDFDYTALYLVEQHGNVPTHIALKACNLGPQMQSTTRAHATIALSESVLMAGCIQDRQAQIAHDLKDGETLCVQRLPDVRSELVIPLSAGTQTIGVLNIQSFKNRAFDQDTFTVLQAIAHQIGIALENANLYAETVSRAQEQVENQQKLLTAEKMASLGRLTAGIAHEMNTPLAAVRSAMSELGQLIDEYEESIDDPQVNAEDHHGIAKEMKNAVTLASGSAARAASFVQGVKSQTRDLSAHEHVNFDPVPVIQESVLLLSHALRQANCPVAFQPHAERPTLYGSPGRLAQVITNLLTNAIDASQDKGGCPITLTLLPQGQYLEARVSDQGSGIPEEILDKVLTPMFTTKAYGKGTGLGLAIVHEIVTTDFRGTLDIESTVGQGTTFILKLSTETTPTGTTNAE
ncbi:MAG: transcriptional regulator, LacI family protein [Rhodocyclales bacterium]|nr:transcriptional regulator, LacI family protein [Rhodocyclales bacterium]